MPEIKLSVIVCTEKTIFLGTVGVLKFILYLFIFERQKERGVAWHEFKFQGKEGLNLNFPSPFHQLSHTIKRTHWVLRELRNWMYTLCKFLIGLLEKNLVVVGRKGWNLEIEGVQVSKEGVESWNKRSGIKVYIISVKLIPVEVVGNKADRDRNHLMWGKDIYISRK